MATFERMIVRKRPDVDLYSMHGDRPWQRSSADSLALVTPDWVYDKDSTRKRCGINFKWQLKVFDTTCGVDCSTGNAR